MNKPQKQTVYLPVEVQGADGYYIPDESVLLVKEQGETDKYWDALVKPQEGYFFTPEQLNEYTQNVIKQALETAAESKSLETAYTNDGLDYLEMRLSKQSITSTFEETFKKFEV